MKNQNKNLLSFLFGAAVGAGLTWLFSSNEGKKLVNETKEKLGKWSSNLKDKMQDSTQNSNSAS